MALAVGASMAASRGRMARHVIKVDGRIREYHVYIPDKLRQPAALVVVFHGGGGSARRMGRYSGFNELADQNGFVAVYPQGWRNNWNDGREPESSRTHREGVDDIKFTRMMLDELQKTMTIDGDRVYAAGISNGAMFCNFLAGHMAERLAAICAISGGIAAPYAPRFNPAVPVSVLIIQGDEDPLVPINGGNVAKNRGSVISTADTVKLWREKNGCKGKTKTEMLPDLDPKDMCRIQKTTWISCRGGVELEYLLLQGGGHTWPSRIQYLPQFLVGRVCRDMDTSYIWDFFWRHPRKR